MSSHCGFESSVAPPPQFLFPLSRTGMIRVVGTDAYSFVVHGIEIEGDNQTGMDVQFPWELYPQVRR